jgi:hypothetical protein
MGVIWALSFLGSGGEEGMGMANPYVGTVYQDAWDQGYSWGYYYPDDVNSSAPTAYSQENQAVYREGVLAGAQAGRVAAAGTGGVTGNAHGGGYSASEVALTPSHGVTVVGDPERAVDPNSEGDAYGDGYNAGWYGSEFDDSRYAQGVRHQYATGWNEGAAARKLHGGEHEHGVAVDMMLEAAPHVAGEVIGHALHVGYGGSALGAILGGPDTVIHEASVYLAVCYRADHGASGLEGGAWCGTPTLELNDATAESQDHASAWGHTDHAVHVWYFKDGDWEPWD